MILKYPIKACFSGWFILHHKNKFYAYSGAYLWQHGVQISVVRSIYLRIVESISCPWRKKFLRTGALKSLRERVLLQDFFIFQDFPEPRSVMWILNEARNVPGNYWRNPGSVMELLKNDVRFSQTYRADFLVEFTRHRILELWCGRI